MKPRKALKSYSPEVKERAVRMIVAAPQSAAKRISLRYASTERKSTQKYQEAGRCQLSFERDHNAN